MKKPTLSNLTCHVITAYGNTAKNVIHAYRAGGERVVGLVDQRWGRVMKSSRLPLSQPMVQKAQAVEQVLRDYSIKGLTLTSGGAQEWVTKAVKLADAGVQGLAANAERLEDKTGVRTLNTLAQAALPGANLLCALVNQIEQQSANLASKIAGDNLVVPVAKRVHPSRRATAAASAVVSKTPDQSPAATTKTANAARSRKPRPTQATTISAA